MKLATFTPQTGMHPFTVSHLEGLLLIRTDTEDLCFWPCRYGHNEVVFEGFVNCDRSVRYLVHRYTKITVRRAGLDTLEYGTFSPRRYQLGQPCNGSITECALSLFLQFCRDSGREPDQLWRGAYPDEEPPEWPGIFSAAEWQGVAYPAKWDPHSCVGLLESLHEINYHSLTEAVSERFEPREHLR